MQEPDDDEMEKVWDPKDGYGELVQRRHINPDGSVGGFVSTECRVAKTAYIGRDAKVIGPSARVKGRARILDEAEIWGNVEGDAVICDRARVGLGCTVKNSAVLSGETILHPGSGTTVEGYAHIKDIAIGSPSPRINHPERNNLVIAGGEFIGDAGWDKWDKSNPSELACILSDNGKISRVYLLEHLKDSEVPLPNADKLLLHITRADDAPPARSIKGR